MLGWMDIVALGVVTTTRLASCSHAKHSHLGSQELPQQGASVSLPSGDEGVRIDIDLAAAEPEAFLARAFGKLDAVAVWCAGSCYDGVQGRDAWCPFRCPCSSPRRRKTLKPQSRKSYERVIDPKIGALVSVRARLLAEFTPPFVVGLRDAIAKRRKRWMANYTVKVLRVAFGWGRIRGRCHTNPAQGVRVVAAASGSA